MKRQSGLKKLVVILWDPHRPTDPAPSATDVDNLIFGATNSVRDYFLENSGGKFTIERAGVLGWFPASRPPEYWWSPKDKQQILTVMDGLIPTCRSGLKQY